VPFNLLLDEAVFFRAPAFRVAAGFPCPGVWVNPVGFPLMPLHLVGEEDIPTVGATLAQGSGEYQPHDGFPDLRVWFCPHGLALIVPILFFTLGLFHVLQSPGW